MDKIPVRFQYEGKEVVGELQAVHGAGSRVWHLVVNKYYWGRLRSTEDGWAFDGNRPGLEGVGEQLIQFIASL